MMGSAEIRWDQRRYLRAKRERKRRKRVRVQGARRVGTFKMFKKKWKGKTLHSEEQELKQERSIYYEV